MSKPKVHEGILRPGNGIYDITEGTPYEITAAFAKVGYRIDTRGCSSICIWTNLDIGTSVNATLKAYAFPTKTATAAFDFPIKSVAAAKVSVEDELFEFNVDADQKVVLEIDTNKVIPFIEIHAKDDSNGDGQLDNLYITFNRG